MKFILPRVFLLCASICCISCNHRGASSQKKIDSLVSAKVQPIIAQLQAQCDSSIIQAARIKADSILKRQANF